VERAPSLPGEDEFVVPVAGGVLVGWRADGHEPALILHGAWVATDYTAPLAAELSPVFATIRYQQRGLSPSVTSGPFDVERAVSDAVCILDGLGIGPVWLIGHSWGGYLAMRIAAAHPEHALGVVAIGTLGAVPPDGGLADLSSRIERRLSATESATLGALGANADFNDSFPLCWNAYFARPAAATTFPSWLRVNHRASVDLAASVAGEFMDTPLCERLSTVACPVVFVHGRQDPLPWKEAEKTAAFVADAQLAVIEDCGHFIWLEKPGALVVAIERARTKAPRRAR
jgi:pimeloyl-ACP methyl ester carboxylesterase